MKSTFIWALVLFLVIPLGTAQSTFTLLDILLDTDCMGATNSMSLLDNQNRLYISGQQAGAPFNKIIQVVDYTNPNNIYTSSCKNQGGIGSTWTVNSGKSLLISTFDGYVYNAYNGAADNGGIFYNMTLDGDFFNTAFQVPNSNGDYFEVQPQDQTQSTILTGCQFVSGDIDELDMIIGSPLGIFPRLNGSDGCAGLTKGFSSGGSIKHIMVNSVGNISLIDTSGAWSYASIIETGTGVSGNVRDGLDLWNDEYLLSIHSNTIRLIHYDDTSNTITEIGNISTKLQNQSMEGLSGVEFISNDTFIVLGVNGTDTYLELGEFLWNTNGSISLIQRFNTTFTASTSLQNSIEYEYPNLFVQYRNGSPFIGHVLSYEFVPTGFIAGDNKKPVFTSFTTDNAFPSTVEASEFNYIVNNPETTSIGERILQSATCEADTPIILRQETFDNSFNFSTFCGGSTAIGSKNGVDFGLGLDLSTCSNDNLLLTQTSNGNTLVSFDMYATSNGTTIFELIEFDGDVIQEIRITYDNNSEWTFIDENNTIFENLTSKRAGIDVPIRFFIQLSPNTLNTNLVGNVYYGTNYFSQITSDEIDKVYCDTSEFCYIGDYWSDAGFINDYFALRIVSSTGNLAIDNYKVESINAYPTYTDTTTLTGSFQCSYDQQGIFNVRSYLSDVTYGHNYLYHEDINITVTLIGLAGIGATTINQSIAQSIIDVAASAGISDPASQQLVAWLVIIITIFGFMWLKQLTDEMAYFIAGITLGFAEYAFFTILGWIPIFWLVLIIILSGAAIAVFARRVISGVA